MSYEYLRTEANNDRTYKISLTLFRDVEQSTVDFDDNIEIGIYLNNAQRDRHKILNVEILFRRAVRPPGSEECDYYSDKRIEMGYYERTVTIAPYPNGYHLMFVRCCRNNQDNLISGGTGGEPDQGQTYYCFIPNPELENSSPRFSGVPSPYMCNNDTNTFLNRAIDPDGDSLVYRIVRPYQGGDPGQNASKPVPPARLAFPIEEVVYKNGYGPTFPFGTSGIATVNSANGLTTLLARNPGSYVIAIEVEEFRNGVSLGVVRLDMQILVLDCPPNNKPRGSNTGGTYFEIEAGEQLCFDVFGNDPDNNPVQKVTVFGSGDIITGDNGYDGPLATIATASGQGSAQTEFCWTPGCDEARDEPYVIAISTQDDGCPPKYHNYNIEIKVNPFEGSTGITGPQRVCATSAHEYIFDAVNPETNSSFWWEIDKGEVVGSNTDESVTVTFLGTGTATIKMVERSQFGCLGDTQTYAVELIPSPSTPIISGEDTVCLGSTGKSYSVPQITGSSYRWLLPDGTIEAGSSPSTTYDWSTLGDFTIGVIETNADGCSSDTGEINVNVRKPNPGLVGPLSVCPNSVNLEYEAQGHPSSTFFWEITRGVQSSGGNSKDITIDWGEEGTGQILLLETDKWGCKSDSVKLPVDITYDLKGNPPVGDTSVCEFDALVPYSTVRSQGSVYDWAITGGNQVSGDSTNNIRVTWGSTGSGNVSVRQRALDNVNNRECLSPWLDLPVVINPLPTADEIVGDMAMCATDDEFTYTVNGFTGSTYTWTLDGVVLNETTNELVLSWPVAGTYRLEVLELSTDSCPGQLIDTTIVIHPIPEADEILGSTILCYPDVLQSVYRLDGFDRSTYDWTIINGTITLADEDSIVVDWNEQGSGELTVVETSEFGCMGDTIRLPVFINRLELDLDRITVGYPDDRMHGEWRTIHDDLKSGPYNIENRAFGVEVNWNPVGSEQRTNFTQLGMNTDVTPFEYRIVATDLCGNTRFSEIHRSVLLTGDQDPDNFAINLQHTDYVGWDNGVQGYEIYRSANASKNYEFYAFGDGTNMLSVPANQTDYRQCFRVRAIENGGQNKISWSNELCFFFSPNVYLPTAFSPNRDGINEWYHPVPIAVRDYEMVMYNRWGEQIFSTNSQTEGWDGTVNGVKSPSGVYLCIVNFTDAEGKAYRKSATVQLMR